MVSWWCLGGVSVVRFSGIFVVSRRCLGGGVSVVFFVVSWWCLGGVSVVSRWCQWCLGAFQWCLGGVSAVSW